MLTAPTLTAIRGQEISVPIRQTDEAGGVQFDLVYDQSALELVRWDDALASDLERIEPGRINYVASQTVKLPELLGYAVFLVSGPSSLIFEDVVMGTPLGEAIDITGTNAPQDGVIFLEETEMNYEAFWDPIPVSYGATLVRILAGDSVDPGDGTFSQVAEVSLPAIVASFSLGANIGTKYCYGVAVDGEGDTGPPHTPVPVSTDLALPALTGFGVRIV